MILSPLSKTLRSKAWITCHRNAPEHACQKVLVLCVTLSSHETHRILSHVFCSRRVCESHPPCKKTDQTESKKEACAPEALGLIQRRTQCDHSYLEPGFGRTGMQRLNVTLITGITYHTPSTSHCARCTTRILSHL